ncbi:unnamed protein product [Cyclocybe aegerita]|uniref:Oxidoreductase AflY n=1 Tax=Cyclocybe aegerita TaxID=1973307 RepID=A0A8S0W2Q9_CYCAE|nr:unnamed protein product [Cyclocybe aegerita]
MEFHSKMPQEIDDKLFPPPVHISLAKRDNAAFVPRIWPGVSAASTNTLRSVLKDNHIRWHVFFNQRGFHNHIPHAALALWCLGADASILEASYKTHSDIYERPAFASPGPITQETWKDHLSDEKYYAAYVEFFTQQYETKTFTDMLEEYVFAENANWVENTPKQPEMVPRFIDGLFHALIHTGYGVEFGVPGVSLEGLAQAAVHDSTCGSTIPASSLDTGIDGDLASRFAANIGLSETKDVHAFSILARVLTDPRFASNGKPDDAVRFALDTMRVHGKAIAKHVDQWTLDGDLSKKVEELLWTATLVYGVGGLEANGGFNADFFLIHLVTSSLFLPTIFSPLKRNSQIQLLKAYFGSLIAWYIGRGRPELDIKSFFANPSTLLLTPPGPHPTQNKVAQPSPTSPHEITPNPWLQIIQSTLVHPDDHVCKLQRALADFGAFLGDVKKGCFGGTELKDAEMIDGTLFLRTAGLTAGRVGWVREGEPQLMEASAWDRRGFF